ncbi:Tryptamine 5-hydroxylase [Camellia lanceoleosa]|uniref:Tryptamine 5-hydroxylase n=1 Tax=Camellia lanceoleosa TaxID=1840588 RepID=A0ACC0IEE0_9ERIC|nr:Tryptamine 5-hydroxylase [Camellia lanceoleosa]
MDNFTPQVLYTILLPLATLALYFLRRQPPLPAAAPPPSPPWLPIIGHLHLLTVKPHHSLAQLAHKLGPIIHLQVGRVNTVVISSAQLAQLVLETHDHVFASRPPLLAAQYLSFGFSDVTFSPYGAYWRQARKIYVTELLSSKRVSSFELVRDVEVNRLISSVPTRTGVATNMSELFFNLANDILCRIAFGKRFMGESRGEERQKPDLATILTERQSLLAGFCIGNFFPEWAWVNSVSGMKRRLKKNLEELREVCDEIISEHVKKRERERVIYKISWRCCLGFKKEMTLR